MANQNILRITKEIKNIQQGTDLSIAVGYHDDNVRNIHALIIGPPGSPYQYGFFEFYIQFGPDYPSRPPKVKAGTTNQGRCRFNPNIYADGKVCLSILGTWQGERPGEEWSSAQGLESILWSIQSLLNSEPYCNEPGFEDAKDEEDRRLNEAYCAKIRHETLRIAVVQKLEHILRIQADGSVAKISDEEMWDSTDTDEDEGENKRKEREKVLSAVFNDLMKRRFLWHFESYLSTIEEHSSKHQEGGTFETMPFESRHNEMAGWFVFMQLAKRLIRVKEVIYEETQAWGKQGMEDKERESSKAYAMEGQFNHLKHFLKNGGIPNIDLELDDGNPFVWSMTYFGKPGSNLDGGVFKIRICISPQFPDEQPRVMVETPMYHHRVSPAGVLCYIPTKPDEMKNHIQTIVCALEETSPPYDPRTIVNNEATKLFWGSADEKKKYDKLQRRCAQRSVEDM